MFGKPTSKLTYNDLDELVNVRNEPEGQNLDYKKDFGNPKKASTELAKDFSSFANSSGGFLIFGVDDDLNIIGVDRLINNKSVDEWVNQLISSNVEPYVKYFDPKVIEIPGNSKVLVVIEIPESGSKPHMVKSAFSYYVRINDSSMKANHTAVRDMFELSRTSQNDFQDFIAGRGLLNPEDTNFGQSKFTKELVSSVPDFNSQKKPMVIFSLIPKNPNQKRIEMSAFDLRQWLISNASGHQPLLDMSLYFGVHESEVNLYGQTIKYRKGDGVHSYFDITSGGYVEVGFSEALITTYNDKQNGFKGVSLFLTQIVGYQMLLMNWAQKFYELIGYYDDALLQISFVNMLDVKLVGFHDNHRGNPRLNTSNLRNKYHNNFVLQTTFNPLTFSEDELIARAKENSLKICNAFGMDQDMCFVGDEITLSELSHFH